MLDISQRVGKSSKLSGKLGGLALPVQLLVEEMLGAEAEFRWNLP